MSENREPLRLVKRPTIDGYQTWACLVGDTSFVVGFDGKYPDRGYSASYQTRGERTVHCGERLATKIAAKRVLEAVLRQRAN